MMAGLPIVAYDLPYLTIVKGNDGVITVRQRDKSRAAQKLIELLSDYEKRRKYGIAGRKFILQYENYDFEEKWNNIFSSIYQEHERIVTEEEQIMMETLISHYDIGIKKVRTLSSSQDAHTERKTAKAAISNSYAGAYTERKTVKAAISNSYAGAYTERKTVKAAILLVKGKDYYVEHGAAETIKKAASKVWEHFRKCNK